MGTEGFVCCESSLHVPKGSQQVAASCHKYLVIAIRGGRDVYQWREARNNKQAGSPCTNAVGDEILPCVLPLHPHGQASLLRSHAGGLSVVSTTECMLYAASEVSVTHRQAVWPLHPPSLALLPTTLHLVFWLTFPSASALGPPCSITYPAGPPSGVLVLYSCLLPQALMS